MRTFAKPFEGCARLAAWLSLLVGAMATVTTLTANDRPLAQLLRPGHVLLLRHANAPGVGDPSNMTIGDCATQRNLDERGRAQAKALGARLRTAGLARAKVFTSQWCRCRETAALLGLGNVKDLVALNSFFAEPERRGERIDALRSFLSELPRGGEPVVLVTHQLTITALTGSFPASGEGVVLRLDEDGTFEVVGAFESEG